MDRQEIDEAVLYPTAGLGIGRGSGARICRCPLPGLQRFIADYCKASPRLKAVANLPINSLRKRSKSSAAP